MRARVLQHRENVVGGWQHRNRSRVRLSEMRYQHWLAANVLEFTSNAYDTVMYDNEGQAVKLPGYRVDAQTDAVIRYIDAHQNDPFFLFVSYYSFFNNY